MVSYHVEAEALEANQCQVRGSLGLVGYYRKFIKNYRTIATTLTTLQRKNTFKWSVETSNAFENLKHVVTNPPILKHPDFTLPFVIECDACSRARDNVDVARKTNCLHEQGLKRLGSKSIHLRKGVVSISDCHAMMETLFVWTSIYNCQN